jgi:hypothetical protein
VRVHDVSVDTLLSLRRGLGPLTAVSALLTIWALSSASLLSAPLAVLFVVAAFCWNMSRFDVPDRAQAADRGCAGCADGCVECRERIEAPEAA